MFEGNVWKAVKSMREESSPTYISTQAGMTSKPQEIVNTMNTFFVSQPTNIRNQFVEDHQQSMMILNKLIPKTTTFFSFREVRQFEVYEANQKHR